MTIAAMKYFDAPFWLALIVGVLLVGALGCFRVAAAQQSDTLRSSLNP